MSSTTSSPNYNKNYSDMLNLNCSANIPNVPTQVTSSSATKIKHVELQNNQNLSTLIDYE